MMWWMMIEMVRRQEIEEEDWLGRDCRLIGVSENWIWSWGMNNWLMRWIIRGMGRRQERKGKRVWGEERRVIWWLIWIGYETWSLCVDEKNTGEIFGGCDGAESWGGEFWLNDRFEWWSWGKLGLWGFWDES